jgi:6-phospho-beta-glucosidase
LISSIYNNKGDVQYVNCENKGAVPGIDVDSGVEIAAMITADGPKPIAISSLPSTIKGTIQNIKAFEQLVCEAAVTGSREVAMAAFNSNPLIPSDTVGRDMLEEMIEAHKEYLPQF